MFDPSSNPRLVAVARTLCLIDFATLAYALIGEVFRLWRVLSEQRLLTGVGAVPIDPSLLTVERKRSLMPKNCVRYWVTEALDTHKATATAEREAQAAHVRAVEDRAHAEIDRAREETKTLQAVLRQKEREASTVASRLETAEAAARAAERLAIESGARATTLEQQLARLDGLPGALLAAQQTMQTALQHEAELQTKLNHRATGTKIRSAPRKRKPHKASEAPK